MQNTRNETICKQHIDEKTNSYFFQIRQYTITEHFYIILHQSERVRLYKQHTSPEKKTSVETNC